MSERLDAMVLIYEFELNLFDAITAVELKDTENIITKHDEFPNWCQRVYTNASDLGNNDFTCATSQRAQDLSPIKFLFASEFDAALARSVIDRLEDEKRLADYKMMSRCFEFPPPTPFILNGEVVPASQAQAKWEATCDPACAQSKTPAMEACLLSSSDKQAARILSMDISTIVNRWDGGAKSPVSDMSTLARFVAWMKQLPTRARLVDYHLDKDFNTTNLISRWSRSQIAFGGPLPDLLQDGSREFKVVQEDSAMQRNRLAGWIKTDILPDIGQTKGATEVMYMMPSITFEVMLGLLVVDGALAIISVALVFIWMRIMTGSTFLAAAGMSEIILSIPVSWFVMRTVGINYFGMINIMTLFMVCAVGADDIFVFMDAYVQSKYEGPEINRDLATRMSWVFRKSGHAMLITSLTTCSAFLCCLATPIPGTQSFGIFAALVIAVDYILVMTLFCSSVIVYHNHFEKPPLFAIPVPCQTAGSSACGCCTEKCDMGKTQPSPTEQALRASKTPEANIQIPDPVQGFFKTKFAKMILQPRFRIVVAVVALTWLIPAAIFMSRLRPSENQEQFLRDDHPIQKATTAKNEVFSKSIEDQGIDIFYTWGLKDVDRDGANMLLNNTYIGKPQFDAAFTFTPECMDKVRQVCDKLRLGATEFYLERLQRNALGEGSIKCFIYDLDAFARKNSWTLTSTEVIKSKIGEFFESVALSDDGPSSTIENKYKNMLGWDGADIKFVGIALEATNLTIDNRLSEVFTRKNYEAYLELADQINANTSDQCGNVQMTGWVPLLFPSAPAPRPFLSATLAISLSASFSNAPPLRTACSLTKCH